MKNGPAPLWRRLWPLAGLVLAAHLALLHGGWRTLTPTKDRWVQQFTTRIVSVPTQAPAPSPAPPQAVAAAPAKPRATRPAPPAAPSTGAAAAPEATPPPAAAPAAAPVLDPAAAPTAATPFVPQVLGVPQPSVMRYEVSATVRGFPVHGQARLDWWHNGQQYDLRLELTGPGLRDRVQQSSGQITEEGLAPTRFSDKARGEQAAHFDRTRGRVVFSNNRPDAAIAPGMQDRLSVVVQLSMLFAGDPAQFPPGTQLAIPTASTREAEDWVFRVEGEDNLELPGGRLRALKLERLPRREFDQKVELWLAPGKDYAPVRLRLTNPDGTVIDQRWSSTDRP
ncbi:MAG TPA: DUF3108 domain-containing protein [Ramlibacter sp.]|uniref:DUF3108 domain-containing protein n=1 Tax=Ramlibacter sp. TaxID=1917967 RepID=UPI002ED4B71A